MEFVSTLVSGETWATDGPVFAIPGSSLKGDVEELPADWSFTDDHSVIEVEVRPEDPYSVNLFCVSTGASLYVASGTGGRATFARALAEDPRIRLRIDGLIYEQQVVRVLDPEEMATYTAALLKKYPFMEGDVPDSDAGDPGGEPDAWLFRVDGSQENEE